MSRTRIAPWLLLLIPPLAALGVWLSPLAFVPVPWPDDSAFYFVARDLFQWPPRWVMIPQAPFEPTYRLFNFNTMPLYPILIGLGRFMGIDGSFALKLWPLAAWAASGTLLAAALLRSARIPAWTAFPVILAFAADPILRWASVLIRPESLVGLAGVALVLGLTFGFPEKLRSRSWWWDPCAALLAIAAYAHFNAIHLLFPVVAAYLLKPRKLFEIGSKTALYLLPWLVIVLWHWSLFVRQMKTQWSRLAIPNGWLSSLETALKTVVPEMGTPVPLGSAISWAAGLLWVLMALALIVLLVNLVRRLLQLGRAAPLSNGEALNLTPSAAWVLGSIWLWHTKPEVWFVYFMHLSIWCFAGLLLARLWQLQRRDWRVARTAFAAVLVAVSTSAALHASATADQLSRLTASQSWRWSTYDQFIDCIDERLVAKFQTSGTKRADGIFQVWGPTFPDVLIELSRRHPDWEFTRTNDFTTRWELAVRHGREVDAVVVTETLRWEERTISAPASQHPELVSAWMTWKQYFLNRLWVEPGWKPDRHICQNGRWQAFLFMD